MPPLTLDGTNGVSAVQAGAVESGDLPAGSVIQVVSTTKTDTFSTTSTSFTDITGLSASITPSSVSSKIIVIVHVGLFDNLNTAATDSFRILRGATAVGVADAAGSRLRANFRDFTPTDSNHGRNGSFTHVDSPNTTSAITYKLQVANQGSTLFLNRTGNDSDGTNAYQARASSSITLMEIAG